MRLQVGLCDAGDRDAVVVPEFDHCVAVRIGGDERFQLLHRLHVGEVVEFDNVFCGLKLTMVSAPMPG